jgi:hypothetical protein
MKKNQCLKYEQQKFNVIGGSGRSLLFFLYEKEASTISYFTWRS